jgi:hypothetical protein
MSSMITPTTPLSRRTPRHGSFAQNILEVDTLAYPGTEMASNVYLKYH